jgi:translation initiation factor 1
MGQCICGPNKAGAGSDGVVRVSRQTKGCNAKRVTVIRGLALDGAALAQLGKDLKTACASGGTVKDGVIEVQGDHCQRAIDILKDRGWVARRAGG